MKYIATRVSKDAALRFFHRRRFANLYGLLGSRRPVAPTGKLLPYLERVWLPFYLIDLEVTSPRGPGTVSVSVEGYSGSFAIFQMHDDLIEGELDEEYFGPQLSKDEAIEIGRKQLLHTILRSSSQQEKPAIEETLHVDVFYYPFWVYYFQRRRGSLDIRIQDALTGERGGNRNRMGLLNAFAAQAK